MNKSYAGLSTELKAPALKMLAEELSPIAAKIENLYAADREGWCIPYHFFWGMNVRNLLRTKGFGEEYFKIDNLDDIYVPLIEEALGLNT